MAEVGLHVTELETHQIAIRIAELVHHVEMVQAGRHDQFGRRADAAPNSAISRDWR